MSWITHRLPTKKDGDGDGDVIVYGVLENCFGFRKWYDVNDGTPFIPYTEPKKASDSASEEPLNDPEEELQYRITVNISFQE